VVGAVFLQQFDDAAHDDRCKPCPTEQLAFVQCGVTAQVFYPDDGARAAIHHEMGPFVNELHIVEWGFREKRYEG